MAGTPHHNYCLMPHINANHHLRVTLGYRYTWYVYDLLVCVEEQRLRSLAPTRQSIYLTLKRLEEGSDFFPHLLQTHQVFYCQFV